MNTCAHTAAEHRKARPANGQLQRSVLKSGCECEDCAKGNKKGVLQRSAVHEQASVDVPDIAYHVLGSPGRPLDRDTRLSMEDRVGHDLSKVRIHTGHMAAESARMMSARAYTVGQHIVFNAGRYAPQTGEGRQLLAHELIHTVQQPIVSTLPDALSIMPADDHHEREAEARSRSMTDDQAARPVGGLGRNIVQRSVDAGEVKDPKKKSAPGETRKFFLTFDDGPDIKPLGKNLTEKVLDTLKGSKYGPIRAGFFIQTGTRGATPIGKSLVERMYHEGHKIGVHTGGERDHERHLDAASEDRLKPELEAAKTYLGERLVEANFPRATKIASADPANLFFGPLTGEAPEFVRPPYGMPFMPEYVRKEKKLRSFTAKEKKKVTDVYGAVGLKNLLWDIDGDQGGNKSKKVLLDRVRAGIQEVRNRKWKGSTPSHIVVLYHDIQPGTVENLPAILDEIVATTTELTNGKDKVEFSTPT